MQLLKYLNENVKNMTENSKSYKNYSKYYEYHDDFSHAAGSKLLSLFISNILKRRLDR